MTSPDRFRAMTTLLALGPWTPMFFQGQEWAASSPFHYFADHGKELAAQVREGRTKFLSQFPSFATSDVQATLPDPASREEFSRCALDWSERDRAPHRESLTLHRDLLALRRTERALSAQGTGDVHVDGAVLGPECLLLRFMTEDAHDELLLFVNLGPDLPLDCTAEPLLAPPPRATWQLAFASERTIYGGSGMPEPLRPDGTWHLKGRSASLLRAMR